MEAAAEMNAPSRTSPPVPSASAASSVAARLIDMLIAASVSRRTCPASVARTGRRTTTRAPTRRSSSATCCETADWV